jgi:hypothetical protein
MILALDYALRTAGHRWETSHGGVWIVDNFENHQRLLRDLVTSENDSNEILTNFKCFIQLSWSGRTLVLA